MNTSKRRLAMAGVLSLALLATACGSDDDSATTTPAAVATDAPSTDAPTPEATDAPAAGATDAPTPEATDAPVSTDAPMDFSTLQGDLVASGATFPQGFYDEAIATLADEAPDLTVEYGGGGSGKGRSDLQEQVVDFAGTDGVVKDADKAAYKGGEFVYVPTVIAPITMSYNLPGIEGLKLTPTTIAKIFQVQITKWNDPAIVADNAGLDLPDTDIVVARRADGSGTTENFSKFLDAAVGTGGDGTWTLGGASELEWPDGTQGGDGNSGVAQIITSTEGAIGYVDLSDAIANDLTFASVQNKAGKFIEPTLEGTTAAAENTTIKDDLTFFLGWADGDDSYPIAAQTWIIAYTKQSDPAKAEAVRGFLTFLLTEGQTMAPSLNYAPLPAELAAKAMDNIAKIGG
ncbi:MAG: phosphate transporter periplasmic phosphate-binding protein [Ilumatobacteraceae bacterium]|nr:phosphate transporter periplasmic phosphate-binding protein [Ilumatobacteraceae bacterium]